MKFERVKPKIVHDSHKEARKWGKEKRRKVRQNKGKRTNEENVRKRERKEQEIKV